jgi:hypothetical protein
MKCAHYTLRRWLWICIREANKRKPLWNVLHTYSRIFLQGDKDKATKYVLRDTKHDNRNKKGDNRYITKIDRCCVCSLALHKRHISRVYIRANIARQSIANCRDVSEGNVEHENAGAYFSLSHILYAIFFQVPLCMPILWHPQATEGCQRSSNGILFKIPPKEQFRVQYTTAQSNGQRRKRNLEEHELHEAACCKKCNFRTKYLIFIPLAALRPSDRLSL